MEQYTQMLTRMSENLFPDDDQYEEKLLAIAATFRTFSQALTSFLCANGFSGDASSIDEKTCYIKDKFKVADIPAPRDIKKWFSEDKGIGSGICSRFHWMDRSCNPFAGQNYYRHRQFGHGGSVLYYGGDIPFAR